MPQRLGEVPRYWAASRPNAVALRDADQPVSYRELVARIDAAVEGLRALGVAAGDRVMIVAENCADEIALLFAASDCGAWPVIVNARLSPREIESIREHCRPRVRAFTLGSPDAVAHARSAAAEPAAFCASLALVVDPLAEPERGDQVEQVAALLYTSGTTGAPKGVMLTHTGLLHFCQVSAQLRALAPEDVVYGVLPLSHIFGFATLLLTTLHAGATLHLEARFTPEAALDALTAGGVTMLMAVPTLFLRLLTHCEQRGQPTRFSRLRYVYVGGGALDPATKQKIETAFGLPAHHGYGMTEYAGSMFATRVERPRSDCSSGEVNPGCEARFVDEQGRDVPAGEVGRILVRGVGTMLGYYRAPELTAEVLRPDGWLDTGDLGRLDACGDVHIVGRLRDLIKRAGFTVYPLEIESELGKHPAVKLAAAIGVPDGAGDEQIVVFVEPRPGVTLDVADLLRHARERLAPYKRPSRIVTLAAMPLTQNGKVRKQELRELLDA